VLSDFQDEIVDQRREGWPPTPSGGIAIPYATVEEGFLRGAFRGKEEVVLALDPIDLVEFEAPGRGN
jgi:hypothetical protein